MKKIILFVLCACLLLSASALGDRLTLTVNETFKCDAEIPDELPQSLPVLTAAPLTIDPEKAMALLMPGKGPREDLPNGDVIVGIGDGEHDYMLVEKDNGRIYYDSEYVNLYLLELMPEHGSLTQVYLPTNLALDFMSPEEAVQTAADLMAEFGIEVATEDAVVYTLECDSFTSMQDIMRQSDWLGNVSRKRALRYLEPLAKEHEGYCVNLTPALNGYPYTVYDSRWEICIFISRQGIEYLDTGSNLRLADIGDEKPIVPLEEAVANAANGTLFIAEGEICTIEKITLLYRYDTEKQTMTPYWILDYCTDGAGGMQGKTFDHWVSMCGTGVDAHTGKVINRMIN